jgi:hemerythrin
MDSYADRPSAASSRSTPRARWRKEEEMGRAARTRSLVWPMLHHPPRSPDVDARPSPRETASMPIWTSALATGDAEIDKQHQEIFRRVDVLCAALSRGDRLESSSLVEFLGTYVGNHFSAEEQAMKSSAYRDLASHKAEHVRFVRSYLTLVREFELHGPSAGVAAALDSWLVAWLNEHILRADVELAKHLLDIAFVMDDVH